MTDWTDARIALLRSLWAAGLSAATISQRMGLTKNQVVGKAHRLGLAARPSPIARRAPIAGGTPVGVRRRNLRGALTRATTPQPTDGTSRPLLNSIRKLVETPPVPLSAGGCRFPLWGNERPTQRFCGAARRDMLCPYCPAHAARAFTSAA